MMMLLTGKDLADQPILARSMFLDRARQFRDRLGWDVSVSPDGEERDEYDHAATTYVIVLDAQGSHAGSMRLLPTTGPTMISEHFSHLVKDIDIVSPAIWECTRFCVSEGSDRSSVALELFQAGAVIMQQNQLLCFVGVFDRTMERVYRRYGIAPEVLGTSKSSDGQVVSFGLWHNNNESRTKLLSRKLVDADHSINPAQLHLARTKVEAISLDF